MAGRGPAPKGKRSRDRDAAVRESIKSDGKLGGFDLPDGIPDPQSKDGLVLDWHPQTREWWEAWRRSPQGTRMMTEPDWHFLLDTALMHHAMWANGRWDFAAEVRLRAAKFGATPEDRIRLKYEIEIPEAFPAGDRGNEDNVTQIETRRDRWSS